MSDCAFCHGTNRQGGYGPALITPKNHCLQAISKGHRSKGQIISLIEFLKHPNRLESRIENTTGSWLYAENCQTCHGSKQLGVIGSNLKEAKKNYTAESLSSLLKNGTEHLMMPSFLKEKGGSMSGNQIDVVSEYLINVK